MIELAPAPEGWSKVTASALEERLATRGLAGELRLSPPLPRLALDPADPGGSLREPIASWEAFLLGDFTVAMVSVQAGNGKLQYSGMEAGELTERALDAAALGEARLGRSPVRYRPVFVECASAGLLALLFRPQRGTARYVTILDGGLVAPSEMQLASGLKSLLARVTLGNPHEQQLAVD